MLEENTNQMLSMNQKPLGKYSLKKIIFNKVSVLNRIQYFDTIPFL